MKIWIDLDNSPHVPLFAPIIEELHKRGHEVMVTARSAFQVKELADFYGLQYKLVGRHYGKHFAFKLLGLGLRAVQLLPGVMRERPALAVSHGSRSQIAACSLLGIPSLLITDYEFARTHAVIHPTWVMVPEVIPSESVRADKSRVLHYPGIKEDVYVPRFRPDAGVRQRLALGTQDLVVTVRPPATEAHYHNPESEELFREVMAYLADDPRVRMIVLPRNQAQGQSIRETWPGLVASAKLILPAKVEDGLNLIWHSDLVISGGGTMNREAAALGVPVYSIFRGPLGAVDRFLESEGRLVVVPSPAQVRPMIRLTPRLRDAGPRLESKRALSVIVDHIVAILASGSTAPQATEAL